MSRVPNLTNQSVVSAHTDDTMLTHRSSLHPENEFRPEVDWESVSLGLPRLCRYDPPDYDIGIAAVCDPEDEDERDPGWMLIVHDLDQKECRWYALGATKKWWQIGRRNFHGKCLVRERTVWKHKFCNALREKRRLGTISAKGLEAFEEVFAKIRYQERRTTIEFIRECLGRCIREECILEASVLGLLDELAGV
ncbi:uncharacterized protein DSM5745_08523 [Aspergillus mulundensis]|uniref:Uncharacterized protein n=1 Tax=Aspergillus mulundensis TaxID=1810919 RepID=A0A3D8R3X8_9EURO|nr:hypothetical protein DSM5745_08523 [Aspergillus mulundensis]RDW68763.1 hypothetical protein DSM5745_08523 [Aspergillus mulundensis]